MPPKSKKPKRAGKKKSSRTKTIKVRKTSAKNKKPHHDAKTMKARKTSTKNKPHHDVHFDMQQMHDTLQDHHEGAVETNATTYFLGVMQYVATELLEVAGVYAREQSKGKPYTIKMEDIQKALENDQELSELFADSGAEQKEPKEKKK